jgi:hypothetical protein
VVESAEEEDRGGNYSDDGKQTNKREESDHGQSPQRKPLVPDVGATVAFMAQPR